MPLLTIAGVASGVVMPTVWGTSILEAAKNGNWEDALNLAVANYTGYEIRTGAWNILNARGLWGSIGGMLGSKAMSMLGVNRAVKRIPLVGRYIKL